LTKTLLFLASKRSPPRKVGIGLSIAHTLSIECKLRNYYATVTGRIVFHNCPAHIFHTTKNLCTLCAKTSIGLLVTIDIMDGRVISGRVDTTADPNVAVCKIHMIRVFTVKWHANETPLVIMRHRRRRILSCYMNIR